MTMGAGRSQRVRWPRLGRGALVAIALIAAAGLAIVVTRFSGHKDQPAAPAAAAQGFKLTNDQWSSLVLERANRAAFRPEIESDGRIEAADTLTTQVFAPVSGQVVRILAKTGDRVPKGAPLAEIESGDRAQAAGDVTAAAAQVRAAEADESRLAQLVKESGASLKDYQQSQAALAAARDAFQAAQARLKAMGATGAAKSADEGRLLLKAPVAGVVTQQAVGVGQNVASVTAGATAPLFVISDLSRVWLIGDLREEDARQARVGQTLEGRLAGAGAPAIEGRVDYVAPSVDPATRRVAVRALVPNPGGTLRPETFVDVHLVLGAGRGALSVPSEALIYDGDQAHIWIADPRTRSLSLRAVRLGDSLGERVEIVSGLADGEYVVTRGAIFVDQASKSD